MKASAGASTATSSPSVQLSLQRSNLNIWGGCALAIVSTFCIALIVSQRLPVSTDAQGVLWPTEGISRLRAPREGFVEQVLVRKGEIVKLRQPLILVRHRLVAAEEVKAVQLREAQLMQRLGEVRDAIELKGSQVARPDAVALIRLEDELSASLVTLREKLNAFREESATMLYAPRDGKVVELRGVLGAEVRTDQALATIAAVASEYRVRAYIRAEAAARVALGATARIQFTDRSGNPVKLVGNIISISALPVSPKDVDRSVLISEPLYEVEVNFDFRNKSLKRVGKLTPGMPVMVAFEVDQRTLLGWMVNRFNSDVEQGRNP